MAFCHGQGNLESDSCCWVNGSICPLRWKIEDGHILEGPELLDRGTVQEFAASVSNSKQIQQRILDQAEGVKFACRAAVEVLAGSPALLNDRAGFEAAWSAHPDYVTLVRSHWADLEVRLGFPAGSYNCSTWVGAPGGRSECCFAEDETTNAAKGAGLSSTAVSIRSQRNVS